MNGYKDYYREFQIKFDKLSQTCDRYTVFYDFIKMCAISIYNALAREEGLEQDYLNTINKYGKEKQNEFTNLFALLILMYESSKDDLTDILGAIYENNRFGNRQLGQCFTPSHISDFMANITVNSKDNLKQLIKERGFISMCEPACGAGGLVLSFAKTLRNKNINYQNELLVEATDISDICAFMTYIQLSLYGIPAIVNCGDTLTMKKRLTLKTPMYFLNYWKFSKEYNSVDENVENKSLNNEMENQKMVKAIKDLNQISLW